MTTATIDFREIAARADLRQIIEAEGIEVRNGRAFCPFHPNERSPALSVYRKANRGWAFRCHSCGVKGDALDWYRLREGLSIAEAARKLDPSIADDRDGPTPRRRADAPHAPTPRPVVARVELWRDVEWQAEVDRIICLAEARLWSPEGRDARRWLEARGIREHTARMFRLGFLPHDVWSRPIRALATREKPAGRKLWARRGVVIPYLAPGIGAYSPDDAAPGPRWLGANVRRLAADVNDPLPDEPKCQTLAETARGFAYPWPEILPSQVGPPALIVEGEFDALLAHQQAGHLAHAITVGGSNQDPKPSALVMLAQCPWYLVATDHDEAGLEVARRWRDRAPHKARRALLPHGKDLTDFHTEGGDVAEWVRAELSRLEPARAD